MSWLLDTCIVSELIKPRPSVAVVTWITACDEDALYLSVVTIGELEKGIAKLAASPRRTTLERWVRRELAERFGPRILPVDHAVASRWGAISGAGEARGVPLPVIDSLIAATSLQHSLVVATRNTQDLGRCGARCFNPWLGR